MTLNDLFGIHMINQLICRLKIIYIPNFEYEIVKNKMDDEYFTQCNKYLLLITSCGYNYYMTTNGIKKINNCLNIYEVCIFC